MKDQKRGAAEGGPMVDDRAKAAGAANASAVKVAAMTSQQREQQLEECARIVSEFAPTLESATSDLLMLLQLVGTEFVRRYYPGATSANIMVTNYPSAVEPEFTAMLPLVVLAPVAPKGGA